MKKNFIITIIIILAVIIFAIIIKTNSANGVSQNLTECIGENSLVYVQLGCHACETQKKLFGDNYQYLNVVDCFYEKEKCTQIGIRVTPTWIINGEKYEGVQSIDKLKELTGC